MTQSQLGSAIGILFQQVQKYENAHDRISSSMLYRFAVALDVPFDALFEGFDDKAPLSPAVDRDGEKLAAVVNRIPNPDVREALINLIEALMDEGQP